MTLSNLEIPRSTALKPIEDVANQMGLASHLLEPYDHGGPWPGDPPHRQDCCRDDPRGIDGPRSGNQGRRRPYSIT